MNLQLSEEIKRIEWRVVKARKMIGGKTRLNVGDIVTQVEPPEDGIVTVQTQDGEVGSLPESCLGKIISHVIKSKQFHISAQRQIEGDNSTQTDRLQSLGGGWRRGH